MGDDVRSVVQLAVRLHQASDDVDVDFKESDSTTSIADRVFLCTVTATLSRICANANDLMLPLELVKQLLKGTDYEKYI